MDTIIRAETFPAGELLAEELEARGWTQTDFAEILGRPVQFVSEVIAGKKEITRESAMQIGAALGTSAQMWLNLQDAFHLWEQSRDEVAVTKLDEVRTRALMRDLAPVPTLKKRGFITSETIQGQAEQLCHLLQITSLDEKPSFGLAARRANVEERLTSVQIAWASCARSLATQRPVVPYSQDRFEELAKRLAREVRSPDGFARIPEFFEACGVAVVYVEAFPSSKIDGCSFLLDGRPVIALSGRGKRLDKVLFTLLHEVAHVLLGHLTGERVLIVDDPDTASAENSDEAAADDLAGKLALPTPLPPAPARIRAEWIRNLADEYEVNPIVIIGRLQKAGDLDWRSALVKGAPNVDGILKDWK